MDFFSKFKFTDYILTVITLLVGISRHLDGWDLFVLCFAVWLILNPMTAKDFMKIVLFLTVSSLIFIASNQNGMMNMITELLFYVLFFGVIKYIYELNGLKVVNEQ